MNANNKQEFNYGQRKQKSEKRNQETEEREAKGRPRDLPQSSLTDIRTGVHPGFP
jgi:hypothetical protein